MKKLKFYINVDICNSYSRIEYKQMDLFSKISNDMLSLFLPKFRNTTNRS